MKILFSKNSLITTLAVILILFLWEFASRSLGSSQLLPGSADTIKTFFRLISKEEFLPSLGSTVIRGLTGFGFALIISLLVGIPSGLSPSINAFFSPFLIIIRSTPVISIILLALIWFKVEQVPVFIGFLTMFPILTTNLIEGMRSVDKGLISMARVYRIKKIRIISDIYLPGTSPFLFSALLTASGFGWRAIIIGEVLSQPRFGIGSMMQQAQSYLMVAELISWTLVAVIVGFLFEQILRISQKRIISWE
ncbi:MAG: ABC transporter permease subunit [Bacteroidales bacterium]|nr:ABC transporter permease subunit [Bacteroidales bacterium]